MKAILTQSSVLTTRYLKVGGDLMKSKLIRTGRLTITLRVLLLLLFPMMLVGLWATTGHSSIGAPVGIGTAGCCTYYNPMLSLAVSVTSPVAVNNTVIIAVVAYTSSSTTVTVIDSSGNSYTKDVDIANSTPTRTLVFSGRVATALTTSSTITVKFSTSTTAINASAFYVSGLVAASPADKTATATGTNTTPLVGPTATTTQAYELLIGAFGLDIASPFGSPTFTAGGGYTALPANVVANVWGIYPEYQTVSAIGAYSANGTWDGGVADWSAAIVTYKGLIVAPTLTSPTATSIASTTATLGANITSDGGASITARGTYWGTTAAPRVNGVAEGGTATGVFTQARTSLTAGTRLYYAGYATNSVGTGYSPDGSFYTEPATQASGVNFTSVTGTGMTVNWTRGSGDGVIVLMNAGSAVSSDPVDGTYTGYTANATFGSGTQIGTGYVVYKSTGTSVAVTNLTPGTTYYVAVYEYAGTVDTSGVDQGTNYKSAPATGNQAISAVAPTLTSPTATSIASTTATLGANITSNGGASITARGTYWATTPTPRANGVAEGGTATGVFTQARTSLTAGTRLYYAGYATNSVGTGYSPDGSFYTEPATQASGVNFTSVTGTGMTVNWLRGSGDSVIVLMKAGSAVSSDPVDGTYTGYTASATFGSGTQIGTGNYVVYKSTGTGVAVTGLTPGTTYYVAVYEYAGAVDTAGVDQGTNYKPTPATGNQATVGNACTSGVTAWRSSATGNWGTAGTWECFVSSAWQPSTSGTPGTGVPITISTGNTVTVAASVSADHVTVNSGGQVTVGSGVAWTINDGTGTDLDVFGTVNNAGTISGGQVVFENGGTYQHNFTTTPGTVPTATWNAGSTCAIIGYTTYGNDNPLPNTDSSASSISGLAQSFANFTWNCPSQSGTITLKGVLTTVNGNFTVTNTGTGSMRLGGTNIGNLAIGGNFSQTNGFFRLTYNNNRTVTVSGSFSLSGGTLDFDPLIVDGVNYSADTVTLNIAGNFSDTGGTITQIGSGNVNTIVFNGTGTQTYTSGGTVSSTINFTVNSTETLMLGTSLLGNGSTGTFTLSSGATLGIGDPAGITTSGATGNIRVSGTRTYNTGANYIYNGTAAQVAGNGLTGANSLTINNPTSVTLSQGVTVSNTLSVTSGIFNQGVSNAVTAGTISVSSGSTYMNRGTGSLYVGAGGVSNSGTIDFFGNSGVCNTSGSKISILSSASGTQRNWTGSGTFQMVDLAVTDQKSTPTIDCYACTYSNVGANWSTANINTCSPSGGLPTAVKLASFTATDYNGKVLLQWLTGYEVDNLGFHIYEEESGQLHRLTPSLIAGSALLVRGAALTAGLPYQWWDTSLSNQQSLRAGGPQGPEAAISGQAKYYLEDIDLKGKHTMHGPVTPVVSNEPLPQTVKPEFLSELGKRLDERYEEFRKIHELKQKLTLATNDIGALRSRGASLEAASSLKASMAGPQGNEVPALLSSRPEAALQPQASQQDLSKQWSLASGAAVKISVNEEGWYRVGQPDLVAAGLNPRVNPQYLQLYVDGKEQPIRVIGQEDKQFGPQDAIEFYGTGLDTLSTDTHVYWLIAGSKAGKRIGAYQGGGPSSQTASFPYTVERKDRTHYFPALINGDEDNFFGEFITGAAEVDELLTVVHTDKAASKSALLEVALQGVTLVPHKVQILFNEVSMGELDFSGQSKGVIQFTIPQSGIPEGSNLVTLIALGGEDDISLVDHIRLTYWHTYTADQDFLKFTAQGGKKLSIGGFSSENIRVMDITDPGAVVEVIGTVNSQGAGSTISSITFGPPGSGQRTLLAFTDPGEIGYPAAITANQASTWHGTNNAADLVMISHGSFLQNLGPLKALRTSQGWSVALINVEDLYDEFNFGAKSPQAIKDFLKLAKNQWRKSPRFVLLVGDASYDPRDYLGWSKSGKLDYVPTKLVGTAYQETASDDWFGDLNNDGLPEMAFGRLPVRTADEATVVVNKIVGYEQSAADAWARRVLLVADIDPNQQFDFQMATIPLEVLIPTGFGVQEIFRSKYGSDADAKADILDSIDQTDQGALLVNFIGHGTVLGWGGAGGLLSSADVGTLINGLRLPFFISMTCLNGFFQAPYADTLAESLLKVGNGGGIAVWASSGMTEPEGQATLNQALIQLLFNQKGLTGLTLGEATAKAKAAVSDMDIRRSWILFGDPTLKLK